MRRLIPFVLALLFTVGLSAQTTANQEYQQAKEEIKNTLGIVPSFFESVPKNVMPGMWAYFKSTTLNPDNVIPPKYRELMQLSIASQIPCDYCVFFHTESAKAYGASEAEIQEAIVHGTSTRAWSMIIQGNQVDMDEFKDEYKEMMSYMAEKEGNN